MIKKEVLLHRFILDIKDKNIVADHKNRNKMDNKLNNLRAISASENEVNKRMQSNNTSGVTGVTWDKSRNKWKVMLNIYGKGHNLGRYDSLEDAIQIRRKAEIKYHGEFIPIERQLNNNVKGGHYG
ncbi:hypothetical protein [Clostridium sp.]|uniref:hypothetical protein n=1 Tax=Clostridium sp. TaxID=1506 RepID=UPI001A60A2BF|nr:hypothetical protein [Clostridium sp.]MBK5242133.1 hypothetical protein [Clostridium sp.]